MLPFTGLGNAPGICTIFFDHMRFDGSATISVFSVDGVMARDGEGVHCGGVMGDWGEQVNWLKRNVSILSVCTMVR